MTGSGARYPIAHYVTKRRGVESPAVEVVEQTGGSEIDS